MLKDSNSCFICGQVLHRSWWRSFGFYDEGDDMKKRIDDMGLENQWEAMRTSLQEATYWSLLPSSTHINLVLYLNFFLN
jgi:DNA-directed RNA polymerase subunit N (RpoN/RPB10)